jgi:CBS domain-containing protein
MTKGAMGSRREELLVRYLRAAGSFEQQRGSASARPARPTPDSSKTPKTPRAAEPGRPGARTADAAPPVLRVRDVMQSPAVSFPADEDFLDMARAFTRGHLSAVPVVAADDQVIGVVSETDLLARAAGARATPRPAVRRRFHLGRSRGDGSSGTASELMTVPPVCLYPETPVSEAALAAARRRLKRIPVTDHRGRLVGTVTRRDLLRALVRDDTAIREEIESRIVGEKFGLGHETVGVDVANGVVVLTGSLDPALIPDLMEAIREIADVADVVDHLKAGPPKH